MLLLIAGSTTSTTLPKPHTSGTSGTAIIGIAIAAAFLVALALFSTWPSIRRWWKRRSLRRKGPKGPAVPIAVRTAFARGDYMTVIGLDNNTLTPATKLLVAQAYSGIGADGPAADAAHSAIETLLADSHWTETTPTGGFSTLETRALSVWLGRFNGSDQDFNQDRLTVLRAAVAADPIAKEESGGKLDGDLDELRQSITAASRDERSKTNRYLWMNIAGGTLAAGLAAASGVLGVADKSTTLIAILSFFSAGISTILTTLKPAERENEAQNRADALDRLMAAIDLLDTDRPTDHGALLSVVREVHNRLAIAEGHPPIDPLGAPSDSPRQFNNQQPTEIPTA